MYNGFNKNYRKEIATKLKKFETVCVSPLHMQKL